MVHRSCWNRVTMHSSILTRQTISFTCQMEHYSAKFPWKEDKPHLPSNLAICTKRTRSFVTKLRHQPELLKLHLKNKNIVGSLKRYIMPSPLLVSTTYLLKQILKPLLYELSMVVAVVKVSMLLLLVIV